MPYGFHFMTEPTLFGIRDPILIQLLVGELLVVPGLAGFNHL
jgi:hypothetical protein